MTLRKSVTRKAICGALLLLLSGAAMAEERKIYKHVDEKGSVVYSQTPPMSGASVKKLEMRPAYSGQGGYSIPVFPYDDSRSYMDFYRQDQYRQAMQQRQQQMDDARRQRLTELEAECTRNRGTDCGNPEALRYIESTKVPWPYHRRY
jgi:hypothetical protein